jgi:hypothetical protein
MPRTGQVKGALEKLRAVVHKLSGAVDPLPILYFICFILSLKNESRLIKSPVCLSVCLPLIIFNRLVEFHEIWYGGNVIQGDLDAIIFNPIASIILKLLRFKFVR